MKRRACECQPRPPEELQNLHKTCNELQFDYGRPQHLSNVCWLGPTTKAARKCPQNVRLACNGQAKAVRDCGGIERRTDGYTNIGKLFDLIGQLFGKAMNTKECCIFHGARGVLKRRHS